MKRGRDKNAAIVSYGIVWIASSSGVERTRGDKRSTPLMPGPASVTNGPRSTLTTGRPSPRYASDSVSPGKIKCGFSTCGLICQISGQYHGSLTNIEAMYQ